MPDLRPETIHAPCKINRNNLIPVLVLQLRHGMHSMMPPNNARNIRRAIQPPELRNDALDPRVDLAPLRHVDALDGVLAARTAEVRLGLAQRVRVHVGDADGRAAGGEELGGCEADAAGTAGDGVDFAGEGHGGL